MLKLFDYCLKLVSVLVDRRETEKSEGRGRNVRESKEGKKGGPGEGKVAQDSVGLEKIR